MICRRNDSDFKTEKDITSHGLLRDPNPYKSISDDMYKK